MKLTANMIPNLLTAFRIPLTIVAVSLVMVNTPFALASCLAVMLIIAVTDALDGYLSRKNNWGSDFGKLFDPMCDAFYFLSMYIALIPVLGRWLAILVILILFRELFIGCLRAYYSSQGLVLSARPGGKAKTVCHMATLYLFVFWLLSVACHYSSAVSTGLGFLAGGSLAGAFYLTFYSLFDYLRFAKKTD